MTGVANSGMVTVRTQLKPICNQAVCVWGGAGPFVALCDRVHHGRYRAAAHSKTRCVYLGGNVCQRERQGRRRITGKYRHRVGVHAIARDGYSWHAAAHV